MRCHGEETIFIDKTHSFGQEKWLRNDLNRQIGRLTGARVSTQKLILRSKNQGFIIVTLFEGSLSRSKT